MEMQRYFGTGSGSAR